ncbi:Ger(x)C family spore germination protein [Aquibacillus halophilus]|uniref:Ger(X)C family spore germination protein n=1 Tax=Aquibacillus halophilus TaxID=930132 RepID=A0A6A8DL23_9BACI|nr:Ger(x)C family spore germination protein [Aquibacillus halophilus]MRH45166.1 Ger(x)C family spore germination protein [Aquibacillus halophilus]
MNRLSLLLYLFCFSTLVGCYDRIELEQQSYVIAIGIDKTDEEGLVDVTFQIANPEVGSTPGGGGEGEEPKETVTLTGTDIISATTTANAFVSKELKLDHTKAIVISEELARSGEFLRVIQAATRTNQIRRGVQIIVTKEPAQEFLNNNKPKMETRPHKYYQLMLNRASEIGIIPDADVHRFFQITEGDADLFLAPYATTEIEEQKKGTTEDDYIAGNVPQQGGSSSQFMGSAVLKEGTMIDVLNGAETRIALTLDNTIELTDIYSTYKDPIKPKYRVAGSFGKKRNTEVNIDYKKNGTTKIDILVPFELEIFSVPSLVDYSRNEKNKEILRKSIEDELEENAKVLIKKSQEEYGSEPFYWSLYVRDNFKTVKEYEQADWNKKIFPTAEINIEYHLIKLEFGKAIDDTKLNEVRD